MRKTTLLSIVLALALLLSACSVTVQDETTQVEAAASTAVPQVGSGKAAAPALDVTAPAGGAEMEIPLALQLALGTVKLDDSDYPVDAEQARQLLPLWKAARSLSQSETVAAAEVDALFKQIEKTMTPEQMQAITDMQLSMQDMAAVAEKLGLQLGPGGGAGNASPEMQATMQAARESGQMPPGGPGGGMPGGGPPGGGEFGGELSPEARQTAEAERGGRGATLSVPSELLEALITFLETKIQ